ncbi:hypothetical protein RF11_07412 [Thelohanellus kitauei]|uniref:Uncharacterized protein n=1 Tax=Thelohanellus kitauei TaxID=669202 RepID=A0A0C2MZH5_THEKT|nr:hypothetical protein RF11_07412 [Thelohanellus kitauei]
MDLRYPSGMETVRKLCASSNFEPKLSGRLPFIGGSSLLDFIIQMIIRNKIGAVVIGYDSQINKSKIRRAITYLICPQVLYFSTSVHYGSYHSDPPIFSNHTNHAGVGTVSQKNKQRLFENATGVWKTLHHNVGIHKRELSSVTTDIAFGKRHNLTTILTMSGDTTPSDLKYDTKQICKRKRDSFVPCPSSVKFRFMYKEFISNTPHNPIGSHTTIYHFYDYSKLYTRGVQPLFMAHVTKCKSFTVSSDQHRL